MLGAVNVSTSRISIERECESTDADAYSDSEHTTVLTTRPSHDAGIEKIAKCDLGKGTDRLRNELRPKKAPVLISVIRLVHSRLWIGRTESS